MKPSASAPASVTASASSRFVIPQILIQVIKSRGQWPVVGGQQNRKSCQSLTANRHPSTTFHWPLTSSKQGAVGSGRWAVKPQILSVANRKPPSIDHFSLATDFIKAGVSGQWSVASKTTNPVSR